MQIARFYNIFILLWTIQFVIGCQHMVIAGAVATWYFMRYLLFTKNNPYERTSNCRDKSKLGNPILYSTYNLIRYHIGSVALGSFLISLVQFIRFILCIVQTYLKKTNGKFGQCLMKCCQCCLYVFEKILKYITRNAYIEVGKL